MTRLIRTYLLLGVVCSAKFALIFGEFTSYIYLQDGSYLRGLQGDTYQSFLGIPYALPPVGQLRFAVSVDSLFIKDGLIYHLKKCYDS